MWILASDIGAGGLTWAICDQHGVRTSFLGTKEIGADNATFLCSLQWYIEVLLIDVVLELLNDMEVLAGVRHISCRDGSDQKSTRIDCNVFSVLYSHRS